MKKGQLLSVLLWVGASCLINTSVAVAATAPSKSANKVTTKSHKKKAVQKTSAITPRRQMTEKDITECTKLIDKVAKTDKVLQNEMLINVTNDRKIAEHLKKPADVQLFASDDPAAIAHLTGKSARLPTPQPSKTIVPIILPPTAKLAPAPIFKPTTATLIASTSHKAKPVVVPPPTAKSAAKLPPVLIDTKVPSNKVTTTPFPNTTKPIVAKPVSKPLVAKPAPTKPIASHPHIELFAPNTPDLNHLEGKSASLADFQQAAPTNKSSTIKKKTSKTSKTKKPISSAAVDTKTKKK